MLCLNSGSRPSSLRRFGPSSNHFVPSSDTLCLLLVHQFSLLALVCLFRALTVPTQKRVASRHHPSFFSFVCRAAASDWWLSCFELVLYYTCFSLLLDKDSFFSGRRSCMLLRRFTIICDTFTHASATSSLSTRSSELKRSELKHSFCRRRRFDTDSSSLHDGTIGSAIASYQLRSLQLIFYNSSLPPTTTATDAGLTHRPTLCDGFTRSARIT